MVTLSTIISAPMALIAGFITGNSFKLSNYSSRISSISSTLLKVSVVGMGFGINASDAISAGLEGIEITIATIAITFITAYFVGKKLSLGNRVIHLIASGTAICGGSAISAVAPAIKANAKEISISMGVVFLLNSIALFIFPIIGHSIGMTQHQFGLWSAIAIHDTSSVVGAASTYGEEALQIATTVKLARTLWIIPISIISSLLFKSGTSRAKVPTFIPLFIGAIAISTIYPQYAELWNSAVLLAKLIMVITIFLIGVSLPISKLRESGSSPILLGSAIWIVISLVSLSTVLLKG